MHKCNKGYTLLELMMYMIMAVMIIGFALNMIGRTQKQYGQQRSMSKLQGAGRNAIYVVAADIQNCGFKNYIADHNTNNVYELVTIKGVTTGEDTVTGASGSSSLYIYHNPGNAYDSIEFFKGEIDVGGTSNDSTFIKSVVRVKYHVIGTTLIRTQKELDDQIDPPHWENETSIEIAENVEALKFEYSPDKSNWYNNPGNKEGIKAIRISMLMKTKRTTNQSAASNSYTIAGETIGVSGDYIRRLYTETVEVVNNGL